MPGRLTQRIRFALLWIAGTVAAAFVSDTLALFLGFLNPARDDELRIIVRAVVQGALIGGAQSYVLRGVLSRPAAWMVFTVIGNCTAALTMSLISPSNAVYGTIVGFIQSLYLMKEWGRLALLYVFVRGVGSALASSFFLGRVATSGHVILLHFSTYALGALAQVIGLLWVLSLVESGRTEEKMLGS